MVTLGNRGDFFLLFSRYRIEVLSSSFSLFFIYIYYIYIYSANTNTSCIFAIIYNHPMEAINKKVCVPSIVCWCIIPLTNIYKCSDLCPLQC